MRKLYYFNIIIENQKNLAVETGTVALENARGKTV